MLLLLIILLILIASVWLGLLIIWHPGYLLLVYQPWMMQMPLWFALLCVLVFLFLFYILITGIDKLQFLWFQFKNWLHFRRTQRSYSATQQGLELLIEERWSKAERLLLKGVNQSVEPLMNYLGAAKAAHAQGAYARRDKHIQQAIAAAPQADLAIGITQAELQLEQEQFETAMATLNHLRQLSPRHPRVLKMLEKIYVHFGEWKNLQDLLPDLYKAKLITREQYEQFQKNIYCELLLVNKNSLEELHQFWNSIPRNMKKNPDVVYAYVKQLLRFNATDEIEELIRKTLKNDWHKDLVNIYAQLPFNNLNRQLVIVGAWLKIHGQQPELLLLLGQLCVQIQLWGKAKDYFEKCLALGPNAAASLAYGHLFERLDEPGKALLKYKEGLEHISR
jgi:HemY protein